MPDSNSIIPVVSYYRRSTNKQEHSIEMQKAWADGAKARFGLDVLREFQDPGIPGDEIEHRPGLHAMLAFCEARHRAGVAVGGVLTYDGERFFRADSFRTASILCRFIEAGASKVYCTEGIIDFENDTDRMIWNIKQDASRAAYPKKLSERVTAAGIRVAREGKWCGGPVPYAYVLGDDGRLAEGDPRRVEAVHWLFTTYDAEEPGTKWLAREAERRGFPPPHGRVGRWTKSNVYAILTNPTYTGEIHYGRRRQGKYHSTQGGQVTPYKGPKGRKGRVKQRDNAPEEVIVTPGAHPALVARELFERVGRKLRANNLNTGKNGRARRNKEYALSGLLRCGDCGHRMTGLTIQEGQGKVMELRQYACRTYREQGRDVCNQNNIPEEKILPLVFEAIRRTFSDPETVALLRERFRATQCRQARDQAERMTALRKLIAERKADLEKGADNFLRAGPDLQPLMQTRMRKWQAEQAEAEDELRRLTQAAAVAAEDDAKVERAIQAFERLSELVTEASDRPEVQRAIQAYVERVEVCFRQENHGRRRSSIATELTVHFRNLGQILMPVHFSLEQWSAASR
jgi:site-specific DNA recombinase